MYQTVIVLESNARELEKLNGNRKVESHSGYGDVQKGALTAAAVARGNCLSIFLQYLKVKNIMFHFFLNGAQEEIETLLSQELGQLEKEAKRLWRLLIRYRASFFSALRMMIYACTIGTFGNYVGWKSFCSLSPPNGGLIYPTVDSPDSNIFPQDKSKGARILTGSVQLATILCFCFCPTLPSRSAAADTLLCAL